MNRLVCLLALVLASGCAVQPDEEAGNGPSFVYGVEGLMVPFPSDRYLAEDEGPRASTDEYGTGYHIDVDSYRHRDPALANFPGVAESLAGLDGFGTSADIVLGLDVEALVPELMDETVAYERSVASDSPIVLLSIDPDDAAAGEPLPFVLRQESDGKTLLLRPWRPLRPSGWYAVVVKPGLRDALGRRFLTPAAFANRYRDPDQTLEGQGYARLREVYGDPVLFALTFRTASVYRKIRDLVADVREATPSSVTYTTRAPDDGLTHVSVIVEGWFTHRNYRNAEGMLVREVVDEAKIPFTLTLPATSATVREPFGVVLGQHGYSDRRQAVLKQADAHARLGMATLAIDAPNHGARGPGDNVYLDFVTGLQNTFGVWTDGNSLTFKAWMIRDVIRQQALDHLQLVLAVKAWQGDVARPGNEWGPDLDFDDLVYTGQSMGGIMGALTTALAPEFKRVLLNVAGGRVTAIFAGNEYAGDHAIKLLVPSRLTDAHGWRMIAMAQTSIESGDPINYIEKISGESFEGDAGRPLLLQAVNRDHLVPNKATFDLARVAGATYVGPLLKAAPDLPIGAIPQEGLSGGALPVLAFYGSVRVADIPLRADHGNLWASDTALEQAAPFLKTGIVVEASAP